MNTFNVSDLLKLKKSKTYNSVILHVTAKEFKKIKNYQKQVIEIDNFIANAKKINKERYDKDKFIVYVDLSNTLVKNMDISFFKQVVPLFENKYPESLEKLILVNLPIFFKTCFLLVKFLINKDTRQRIYFQKKNETDLFTNSLDEIDIN